MNRWALLIAVALAALTAVLWSPLVDLALLGWDAYPLIAASRVDSLAAFFGTFGEELMDGRYPLGSYYRPLVHLSFALDHALWGLDPRGYHATDIALAAASGVAMFALAWTWFGERAEKRWLALVAAALAGLELATHPAFGDVLPAAARRADTLAMLFTLLALTAHLRGKHVVAALLAVAALASKETGAIATVVIAAHTAIYSRRWRELLPLAIAVALFLCVRTAVLGGIGGGRESSLALDLGAVGRSLLGYGTFVLGASGLQGMQVAAPAAVLALAVFAGSRAPAPSTGHARFSPLALLGVWFVALVAITALSGVDRGWYGLQFVVIRALLIAWLVTSVSNPRTRAGALRLALAVFLLVGNTWLWIPEQRLADWRHASAMEREFLDRFEERASSAATGERITLAQFPMEFEPQSRIFERKQTIAVLAPYSVAAYAELTYPARAIRIELLGAPSRPPARDELVVVLAP